MVFPLNTQLSSKVQDLGEVVNGYLHADVHAPIIRRIEHDFGAAGFLNTFCLLPEASWASVGIQLSIHHVLLLKFDSAMGEQQEHRVQAVGHAQRSDRV